jgi:hypothetical protein
MQMKKFKKTLCITLLILCNFIVLVSQPYYEGEFEIREYIRSSDPIQDSIQNEKLLKNHHILLSPKKIIYNKDKVVLLYINDKEVFQRIVYDYKSNRVYNFKYPKNHPYSNLNHECFTMINQMGINNVEIGPLTDRSKIVLGEPSDRRLPKAIKKDRIEKLDCVLYRNKENMPFQILWYTDQIILPYHLYSKQKHNSLDDSLFCIKHVRSGNGSEHIVYELANFSNVISNSTFLETDSTKFMTKENYDKHYNTLCDSIQNKKPYEKVPNGGENADKVVDLINNKALPEFEYFNLDIKDHDFYSLIDRSLMHFGSGKFDSLNNILLRSEIITQDEKIKFDQYHKKSLEHDLSYPTMLRLHAINKILNQKISRQRIVTEIKTFPLGLVKNSEKVFQEFLAGNKEISSVYDCFTQLQTLNLPKQVHSKSELVQYIGSMTQSMLPKLKIQTKVEKNIIVLTVNEVNYHFRFEDYGNFSNGKSIANLDLYHHEQIIDKIRQIAADNRINKIFEIDSFLELFRLGDVDQYQEIVKVLPELKFLDKTYYTLNFNKSDIDFMKTIDLSFPDSLKRDENQLYIRSIFYGDERTLLTIQEKEKLITLVEKNQADLKLDQAQLDRFKISILDHSFYDIPSALHLLPFSSISISRHFSKFPLVKNGSSIKESFPDFYNLFNGHINGTNIQMKEYGPYLMIFNHNSRTVGVKKKDGENNWDTLLRTMSIIMDIEMNSSVYKFQSSLGMDDKYILLDNDFADEIKNDFGPYCLTNLE